MKQPTQPELPALADTRQVTVFGAELVAAIARLNADGFTCSILEHVSNAG